MENCRFAGQGESNWSFLALRFQSIIQIRSEEHAETNVHEYVEVIDES